MPGIAPIFRFAPSPNGRLHLGHAYSALFTHDMAQRSGGRFLLRMEDIDATRCRPEFETQIYEDLRWLGLEWEEPVRRQSEHFADYAAQLAELENLGVLFACFATRREIAESAQAAGNAADPDGAPLYPGLYRDAPAAVTAKRMAAGDAYAVRLHMAKAIDAAKRLGAWPLSFKAFTDEGARMMPADPARWGDAVLARKDAPASYHLAVVTDDALQGVTHVTRGADLLAATDLHRLLQILLGLPSPVYSHHRLIVDGQGRKLSKRDRDKSLAALRAEGATPASIRQTLGLAPIQGK